MLISVGIMQRTIRIYRQLSLKGTKATVRFREVSALERIQLQRYKCNSVGSGPNLLAGTEIQVQFGREWTKFAGRFREVSA